MKNVENITRDIKRNYPILKGRIGEAIVEQLFGDLGYEIFRYGVEKNFPALTKHLKNKKLTGRAIESIRFQPDYVVYSPTHKLFFLEVKFYKAGWIDIEKLKLYKDPDIIFVLMTKNHIGCIKRGDLDLLDDYHETIDFKRDCISLHNYPDFEFKDMQKIIIKGYYAFTDAFSELMSEDDLVAKISKLLNSKTRCKTEFKNKTSLVKKKSGYK
jgi:hypothetical protein